MYQAWPWGAAPAANPAAGYVQPTPTATPVAAAQWPAGYGQYAVTPEMQQQWAAAWANQAQYAYGTTMPTTDGQTPATFAGAYPNYQTAAVTSGETKISDSKNEPNLSTGQPKPPADKPTQNLSETEKIKELKEQAEKWTSQQQPPASAASWSYSTAATNASAPNTNTNVMAPQSAIASTNVTESNAANSQLSKEEEEFERQFKDWEKQFEAWKQQNQNHPDKEAFAQYEKQWQEWREQLLQKKEQMQRAKAAAAATNTTASQVVASVASSTPASSTAYTNTTASSTAVPGMYYQPSQYMYMQPYMYPGAAPAGTVPPVMTPGVVMPPAAPPAAVIPPGGGPPTSMPPSMMQPSGAPSQMPYSGPNNFGKPPPQGGMAGDVMGHNKNVNYQDNQSRQDYDDGYGRGLGEGRDPGFKGYGDSNMEEWNFNNRGGGRGRGGPGRGRGRGGMDRWGGPPPDMDRSSGPRNQRKTLLPGGPFDGPPDHFDGPPDCFDGPPGGFDRPNRFDGPPGGFDRPDRFDGPPGGFDRPDRFDGPGGFDRPPNRFDGPPDRFDGPPDRFDGPPDRFDGPPDRFDGPPDRFDGPPDRFDGPPEGFDGPGSRLSGPRGRGGRGGPPGSHLGGPAGSRRGGPPGRRFGGPPSGPLDGPPEGPADGLPGKPPGGIIGGPPKGSLGKPPGDKEPFPDKASPPPFEYPTEDCRDQFGLDGDNFSTDMPPENPEDEGFFKNDDGSFPQVFPEDYPPDEEGFPPSQERFPPGGRFPPGKDRRFPPEDEAFPPNFPPNDRFMGRDRFPPRHMMDERRFNDRGFDHFMPEDDMYGPPPFRDDFPPFNDRGPQGRGRFNSRGRGRFHDDFDRFGGPFPPMMDNEPFGPPDFPPDERFGFPGDRPPPMGMRPPFGPEFGPEENFHERPSRFETIDYTHRRSDDFNPYYDYEGEFQDDVHAFRDNFNAGAYLPPCDTLIFSQVNVESFDYEHGVRPVTSTIIEGKPKFKDPVPPVKGSDAPFSRDRSPSYRGDRNFNQNRSHDFPTREPFQERDNFRQRERDRNLDRDRDRDRRDNRDRDRDNYDRDRGRDRDSKRERDSDRDQKRGEPEDKRFKHDRSHENKYKWEKNRESDLSKDKNRNSSSAKKENDTKTAESTLQYKPQPEIFKNSSSDTVLIEDILTEPKRSIRPKQLVIILRGLPGSGKTHFAKLIKDKEIENGGSAPRILSLDDYFMVESEVVETDPDSGKKVKKKDFKFEYELEMEEAYRSSLFKSFKKTIDDRFFPFIIVDAVNEKSKHYEQYWSYAKQKGFQVYIAEMDCKDPVICHKRNVHNRTLEDINKILSQWETKPKHFISMDVRSLLQDVSITEVEMEVETAVKPVEVEGNGDPDADDDIEEPNPFLGHEPSRWEKLEATEEKLDQLDGIRAGKMKHSSMEDYLQLPDDYEERKCEPGKKRVRWADLEERKEQDRLRAIGFVVGQTDWAKMTDPSQADKALTKTKYF